MCAHLTEHIGYPQRGLRDPVLGAVGPGLLLIDTGRGLLRFSVGRHGRFRFYSSTLAEVLKEVFQENGVLDGEHGPYYEGILIEGGRTH